jgi:hypothetical protein
VGSKLINCKNLLLNGYSYSQIKHELSISKGSINYCFKHLSEFDQARIRNFRINNWKLSYRIKAQKIKEEKSKEEKFLREKSLKIINYISKRELLLIGSSLYWAEGGKTNRWGLQFSNSDQNMIILIMKYFREIIKVPEEKFYMQMILHANVDENLALDHWSKITQVDKLQFKKACYSLSKSSKQLRNIDKLPYGTLQVRVHNKKLTQEVYGYIEGIKKNISDL